MFFHQREPHFLCSRDAPPPGVQGFIFGSSRMLRHWGFGVFVFGSPGRPRSSLENLPGVLPTLWWPSISIYKRGAGGEAPRTHNTSLLKLLSAVLKTLCWAKSQRVRKVDFFLAGASFSALQRSSFSAVYQTVARLVFLWFFVRPHPQSTRL